MTTNLAGVASLVETTGLATAAGRAAAEDHYDVHGPQVALTEDILRAAYLSDPATDGWPTSAWLAFRDAAMDWWATATQDAERRTLLMRQRAPTRRMARISEEEAAARIMAGKHRDTDLPPLGMPEADYETYELVGWDPGRLL